MLTALQYIYPLQILNSITGADALNNMMTIWEAAELAQFINIIVAPIEDAPFIIIYPLHVEN